MQHRPAAAPTRRSRRVAGGDFRKSIWAFPIQTAAYLDVTRAYHLTLADVRALQSGDVLQLTHLQTPDPSLHTGLAAVHAADFYASSPRSIYVHERGLRGMLDAQPFKWRVERFNYPKSSWEEARKYCSCDKDDCAMCVDGGGMFYTSNVYSWMRVGWMRVGVAGPCVMTALLPYMPDVSLVPAAELVATRTPVCEEWYVDLTRAFHLTLADVLALRRGDVLTLTHFDRNMCDVCFDGGTSGDVAPKTAHPAASYFKNALQSTYTHSEGVSGALVFDFEAPGAAASPFTWHIEYKPDCWYPLCDNYECYPRDEDGAWPERPAELRHWSTYPGSTRIGYRGPCVRTETLAAMPDVFYGSSTDLARELPRQLTLAKLDARAGV